MEGFSLAWDRKYATGKDHEVRSPATRAVVGMRKKLVFYQGRAPNGAKSSCVMREFRLDSPHLPPRLWDSSSDWVSLKSLSGLAGNELKSSEMQSRERIAASVLFDWDVLILHSFVLILVNIPPYAANATKKFEKLITDKKEIDGLPATALGLAAQTAVSKGHENASAENGPWIITLDAPSYMAVMQHAKNRALREEVYRAYLTRASSGDLDNTNIISQILSK